MVQNERITDFKKVRKVRRLAEILADHPKANEYERATCAGIAKTIKQWRWATITQVAWVKVLEKELKKRGSSVGIKKL